MILLLEQQTTAQTICSLVELLVFMVFMAFALWLAATKL